ncbi:MAG: divalent-cation tolerance protein CutA [Nitrosomonas sp.]|nr:divalent-cation tolerance protein CutA [Nitrosomonas sp.]
MTEAILILTNFPDKESASKLAHKLIDEQLAACVNIMNTCTSIYRWQDVTESADETPVFIKTRQKHYKQVEELIKSMHPYELPEVIIVPITGGMPAYLQWIIAETRP